MKLDYSGNIYEKKSLWGKFIYSIIFVILIVSVTSNINLFIYSYRTLNYANVLAGYEKMKNEQGIESLKTINEKFTAWVKVNDVKISLPVVQAETKDEEYFYMTHDLARYENVLGVPYVEHNCNLNESFNTVIVGHSRFSHTRMGKRITTTIFGDLINYTTYSKYYGYTIDIETLNASHRYEVVGAFKFSIYDEHEKEYLVYSTKEINNETQFNNFYNTLLEVSTIDTGVTASYGDKFLTLFTCSEENLDYRVAVVAKQIY